MSKDVKEVSLSLQEMGIVITALMTQAGRLDDEYDEDGAADYKQLAARLSKIRKAWRDEES
ncbi:MAG: hypothetical protein J2P54_00205 [Bradyrhizobiaceae bacterium]|nr:hypothetical protein [Bradyrhizobiaceae bacterium]